MSTMTLKQVRDLLDTALATQVGSRVTIHATRARQARDALDAHLAQPAQAVDVGAIREVIDFMESRSLHGAAWEGMALGKLTRALAGEKSPQTLANFVNLPDAERVAGGQQVAAAVDVAMGEKAGPVGDEKILWGLVANAGRCSAERKQRWAHVLDAAGLGSQSSIELCRRFGFDPDEQVGGEQEACESHLPDCGSVAHWDSEGIPLCERCWNELAKEG